MQVSRIAAALVVITVALAAMPGAAVGDVDRLVAALLGDTAMTADLQQLTDVIGGRATGSLSNEKAIDWALAAFKAARVDARREPFEMPKRWLETLEAQMRGMGVWKDWAAGRPGARAGGSLAGLLVLGNRVTNLFLFGP